jgi:hypothetical protein
LEEIKEFSYRTNGVLRYGSRASLGTCSRVADGSGADHDGGEQAVALNDSSGGPTKVMTCSESGTPFVNWVGWTLLGTAQKANV